MIYVYRKIDKYRQNNKTFLTNIMMECSNRSNQTHQGNEEKGPL